MKNKYGVILSFLFLSVFIMHASYENQKAEWKGTIYEENGVRVIKNPKKPIYSGNVFDIIEELSIGDAKGREEYQFSRVSGIAVDEAERTYVLDYKEAHIKVFDRNGCYVKTIGRKGQGPGEMTSPFSISITEQNKIMVQDLNTHQLMFFLFDGSFLKSISSARMIMIGSLADSRGNIVGIVSTRGPESQIIELKKFDSSLRLLYSYCSFSLPIASPAFNPFRPEICWAVTKDDYIICGYPESYEFKVFNPDGKAMRKIIKDHKPIRIAQDEIEKTKKRLPGPMKLDIPKFYSAYQRLAVDEDGRIFVQTWEKPKNGQGYYHDIFDPEGRYIAKIPLKSQPWIWKKNTLYSIEENKEGFQVVKRYKIKWNI